MEVSPWLPQLSLKSIVRLDPLRNQLSDANMACVSPSTQSETKEEADSLLRVDHLVSNMKSTVPLLQPSYVTTAKMIFYLLSTAALLSVSVTVVIILLTIRNIEKQASSDTSTVSSQDLAPQTFGLMRVPSLIVSSGNCSSVRVYNVLAHFILNGIGTLILGASNYLQQICTSPTAEHVIHREGNIKFGSNMPVELFRNKGWQMKLFWILLISTSLPLHLMLNGIIGYEGVDTNPKGYVTTNASDSVSISAQGFTTVGPSACVRYIDEFWGIRSDFTDITIVVTSASKVSYYSGLFTPGNFTHTAEAADISQCYLRLVQPQCKIGIRWAELIVVSTILIVKLCVVYFFVRRTTRTLKNERLFNSIGDFMLLAVKEPRFHINAKGSKVGPGLKVQVRWISTLGFLDFCIWAFWFCSILSVTIIGFVGWKTCGEGESLIAFAHVAPIGSTNLMVQPGGSLFANESISLLLLLLLANCPQLWVSICYLLWNNQLTRIWMEHEWRSYYLQRQRPRISHNAEDIVNVRNTRFLQLPYSATAFLMTTSTVLHWLVSQAFFVTRGIDPFQGPTAIINWSPIALLILALITLILLVATTIHYFTPFNTVMPFMGGSAHVVMEACYQLRTFPSAGIEWGDISTETEWIAGFGETVVEITDGVTYPGGKGQLEEKENNR